MTDSLEQLKEVAIASIKDAFPVESPPAPEEMRNDHCSECRETAARFAGKCWNEITAGDLVGNPSP